jgi:hypothetical protein
MGRVVIKGVSLIKASLGPMTNSQRTVFCDKHGGKIASLAENAEAHTARESPLQETPSSNVDLPGLSRCQGRADCSSKHDSGGEN